jgi:UDP-N-acetylglucosamine 4-epimerase
MTTQNPEAINTVYNTAFGDRTTLTQLVSLLKENLSAFDAKIGDIEVIHGPNRAGDIPHSLASIDKAKLLLGYKPQYSIQEGLKEAVTWYYNNLKQ